MSVSQGTIIAPRHRKTLSRKLRARRTPRLPLEPASGVTWDEGQVTGAPHHGGHHLLSSCSPLLKKPRWEGHFFFLIGRHTLIYFIVLLCILVLQVKNHNKCVCQFAAILGPLFQLLYGKKTLPECFLHLPRNHSYRDKGAGQAAGTFSLKLSVLAEFLTQDWYQIDSALNSATYPVS